MKRLEISLNQPMLYQMAEAYDKLNSVLINKDLFGSYSAMKGGTDYLSFLPEEDVPLAKIRDNIKRFVDSTFDDPSVQIVRNYIEKSPADTLRESIMQ